MNRFSTYALSKGITKSRYHFYDNVWGYALVGPWILSFAVFTIYPFLLSLKVSFLNINLISPERAVFYGFKNYIDAVSDGDFWLSLFNVVYNQAVFIPLSIIVGLLFAFLIYEVRSGNAFYKTVYFLPVLTSAVVMGMLYMMIAGENGPVQKLLVSINLLDEPVSMRNSQWGAMPVLALFNTWKWFGVNIIIFIAALAGIDNEILEAAYIDGASWLKQAFRIRLPLLRPQIVFLTTINIINGLQMFGEVLVIFNTDGGTYKQGLTPVLMLYMEGFSRYRMGFSSTIGILLAIFIFILTIIQIKFTDRSNLE